MLSILGLYALGLYARARQLWFSYNRSLKLDTPSICMMWRYPWICVDVDWVTKGSSRIWFCLSCWCIAPIFQGQNCLKCLRVKCMGLRRYISLPLHTPGIHWWSVGLFPLQNRSGGRLKRKCGRVCLDYSWASSVLSTCESPVWGGSFPCRLICWCRIY